VKQTFFKKDYIPIPGFFNLLCFDLTATEFRSAWRVQLYLKHVQNHRSYFKNMNKLGWNKAKLLSAELQSFLLPRLKQDEQLR